MELTRITIEPGAVTVTLADPLDSHISVEVRISGDVSAEWKEIAGKITTLVQEHLGCQITPTGWRNG